ncbi:alpha/beta fold hydrolase [Oxalobacteraceae bacterium OTU3CAMAD1]|nr:alpha/beta fold hydrolase [Oxalobacteraceae bacterium OTU3CAMAD1]
MLNQLQPDVCRLLDLVLKIRTFDATLARTSHFFAKLAEQFAPPRRACIALLLSTLLWAPMANADDIVRITRQPGPDCQAPCSRVAVVFFHGLNGSAETWKNPDTKKEWPRLLAEDRNFAGLLDVYTVSYDSFLFAGNPSFTQVLKEMSRQLDDLLFQKKYSKIVLVGHSLGGNFARAYLLHVKSEYGHIPLSAFRLMYTLGTPIKGSQLATFARFLTPNPHLRVLLPLPINDFQQKLEMDWTSALNKQFRHFCDKIEVHSAYEKIATLPVGIIVPRDSASAAGDYTKGFDLDHGGLAKPPDTQALIYKWVASGLHACVIGESACTVRNEYPNCGREPTAFDPNRGLYLWDEALRASVPPKRELPEDLQVR